MSFLESDTKEFIDKVNAKRRSRMERIDRMPPEMRALVHEYGLTVVNALVSVGVTKPKQIKHVVETVLDEFSPTRGSFSRQGRRGSFSMPEAPE